MTVKTSDARRRELGAELRRRREAAELSAADIARKLGLSASAVSRIESGHGGVSEVNITAYLAHCGVTARGVAEVLKLAKETEDGYLLRVDSLRTLILHETTARQISVSAPSVVPGLLQTEGYARAMISLPGHDHTEVDSRVALRMDRQRLLRGRRAPRFTYFLYEAVLHCPFGGNRVMNEQMLHLAFLADLQHITIRMVPFASGQFATIAGALTLMDFAEHGPVAYLENPTAGVYVENRKAIERYRFYLGQLAKDALNERQSRGLLADLASRYDQPEGAS